MIRSQRRTISVVVNILFCLMTTQFLFSTTKKGKPSSWIANAFGLGHYQQRRISNHKIYPQSVSFGIASSSTSFTPYYNTQYSLCSLSNNIHINHPRHLSFLSSLSSSSSSTKNYNIKSTSLFSSFSSSELESKHQQEEQQEQLGPATDTIFALSSGYTGQQATALAVIRISGPNAHTILQKLSSKTSKLPPPRRAILRKLYHPTTSTTTKSTTTTEQKRMFLDHALVLLFEKPNSFTGEDLIELHCHGSRAVVQGLLDVLPTLGLCRMAEPGEFTQRAFGNGKFDLVQVEALADLLAADTSSQLQQALEQLDGKASKVYDDWRSQLISGLAHAEAVIDFGDDEHLGSGDDDYDDDNDAGIIDDSIQWDIWGSITDKMDTLRTCMERHLQDERKGEIIREGISIAIIGPPNAGKSSLFNLLARRDAAIVSPIAGTTRDIIQVTLDLGGIKCILQDTAGVRSESETSDTLEWEGMKRTRNAAKQADLVVAMIDASTTTETITTTTTTTDTTTNNGIMDIVQSVLQEEDEDQTLDAEHTLVVLNKLDLVNNTTTTSSTTASKDSHVDDGKTDTTIVQDFNNFNGPYEISCETQEGIDIFLDALTKAVISRTEASITIPQQGEGKDTNIQQQQQEGALITRARHRQHVEAAVEALERFDLLSREGAMAVDMAAEELRLAASELGRITGAVDVEDVLDVLFTDFCIGK